MEKLKNLITQATARNKNMTALTLRVPDEVLSFVEEFAENFSLSRQEVMLALIETGIDAAKVELENRRDPLEAEARFHILNTNRAHNDEDQAMMMAEGIAAAFYDPWKLNIDRIKKDDWVFLYENQKGIVAFGQGSGQTLVRDHEGKAGECHYQRLKGFAKVARPLPAKEIKKILGRHHIFLRTMSAMPAADAVLAELRKRAQS